MSNEIEDYFMRALRLQALVHTGLTSEHQPKLCDAAAMRAHLDKYSRIEQCALLTRVIEHLNTVVAAQALALEHDK